MQHSSEKQQLFGKKMLFIFNPATGGGRLKNRLMDILCHFSTAGFSVTVFPTAKPKEAKMAAKNSAGYTLVVCCGGDGTLNEVVDGLVSMKNPPLLGYIPGGTTNDFASSLLLPKSNMLQAAQRITSPKKIFQFDVGKFQNKVFNYVAAFGAFTDVAYETPQKFKNLFGYFAYVLEALQRLPNLPSFRAKVVCDGGIYEGDFMLGMISNSISVGGFSFQSKKTIRMDDGIFEVILVRQPRNILDLGELSAAILTRNTSSPSLITTQTSSLVVESEKPIPWTLDGEFGGKTTTATIRVKQRALRICI